MKIEVVLSPMLYPTRQLQVCHTTVAVDILRATSAICAAFQAGAKEIIPLNSLEPLADYYRKGYTIAAERGGAKVAIEGVPASCGNSPTEYMSMNLKGQRLTYSTTNGTVSITTAAESEQLYVGAFANLDALSSHLLKENPDHLVILCSGWKGDPCIEDTLFAGALCKALQTATNVELINDAALFSVDLWNLALQSHTDTSEAIYRFCAKATHVHRLQQMNYDCDIRWAFRLNTCPIVPKLTDRTRLLPAL